MKTQKKYRKGSPNDRFSAFDSFVIDSPLQNFVHYKKI